MDFHPPLKPFSPGRRRTGVSRDGSGDVLFPMEIATQDPSPGEKVAEHSEVGRGMREKQYQRRTQKGLLKSYIERNLFLPPHPNFPPAFLISHKIRFRSAGFCDSFPPGEAEGAAALEEPSTMGIATALRSPQ